MRHAFLALLLSLIVLNVEAASNPTNFIAVQPCRLVDTRGSVGPFGGPALSPSSVRTFSVPLSPCGLPAATAYSISVTIVGYDTSSGGWITAYPTGSPRPFVSTVNFGSGPPVANAAIVAANGGSFDVYSAGTTHLIIDVNGYFAEPVGTITGVTAGAGLTGGGTTGTVSLAVNFAGSGTANTAARSDHKHYERTIIVSPSGGGAALRAALNGITDASATNPYLVKVEPGSYDLSVGCMAVMQPYVDLEGSGEGSTLIHLAGTCPVVYLADNSEIRSVTLEHDGAASGQGPHAGGAVAVSIGPSGGAPRLRNVTLIANATGGGGWGASLTAGPVNAVFTDVTILVNVPSGDLNGIQATGSLTLDRVNIRLAGGSGARNGIVVNDGTTFAAFLAISRSSVSVQSTTASGTVSAISVLSNSTGATATLTDVQANASAPSGATVTGAEFSNVTATMSGSLVSASIGRGVFLSGTNSNTFTAENSRIVGPDNTVSALNAAKTVRIASTRLDGGPVSATSPVCSFVWDEAFAGYASTCP
jgi:hypothetical protein